MQLPKRRFASLLHIPYFHVISRAIPRARIGRNHTHLIENNRRPVLCTAVCLLAALNTGCGDSLPEQIDTSTNPVVNLDKEPNNLDSPVKMGSHTNIKGTLNSHSDKDDTYVFVSPSTGQFDITFGGPEQSEFFFVFAGDNKILLKTRAKAGRNEIEKLDLIEGQVYMVMLHASSMKNAHSNYQFGINRHIDPPPTEETADNERSRKNCSSSHSCRWVGQPPMGFYQCSTPTYSCN